MVAVPLVRIGGGWGELKGEKKGEKGGDLAHLFIIIIIQAFDILHNNGRNKLKT